ncbi:MAG: RluA family pseudouridine synthase [Candidatus Kuenenia sp.]|nr:RluA family pseudouridine synthase [Candidatus Kuenenia hertensis]
MQKKKNFFKRHYPKGLGMVYEDEDILVIDKPAGLLTMGTETNKTRTAYYILTDYVRKGCAKSRKHVFIVHRLDRDASGILVFAKNVRSKLNLQEQWQDTEKKYLAVVCGRPAEKSGTISTYLTENRAHVVYSTSDTKKGKLSHTAYKVVKETRRFSLLEIKLLTGRKNQIRVHLAERGHPIVGDKKYGKENGICKWLALHAHSISFRHPSSGEFITFESKTPWYFNKLIGSAGDVGKPANQ